MASEKDKILNIVRSIMDRYSQESDIELYHLEYVKEGPDMILRVYIDKPSGYIGTDDCEKVSRVLSDEIDKEDPISQNYILEVSSPGIDRALVTEEHFKRYIGEKIDVSLYRAINNSKHISGLLMNYKNGDIVLKPHWEHDSEPREATSGLDEIKIESNNIAKASLAVDI